ncbi:glutamate racemase [Cetobacterium sp. SF1]|uniref:glutamate racemase n=1 Tax=unclassified Cetobacterium TaxID=2630983 RepID=UPI003CE98D6B
MYKIGIFDSGVGGLTVLKEVEKLFPSSTIIYFADNANSPYGDKTGEEIKELCLKIAHFLYSQKVDAIVIACNTATAAAFQAIKDKFNIPIIGVIEPGVKTALDSTSNGKISVLATPATVNLNAYKKIFEKLAPDNYEISQRGCKLLCPMIEEGWHETYSKYFTHELISLYLEGIPADTDTLILGCTHYPLIKEDISELFHKTIIDPAHETVLELKRALKEITPKHSFLIPITDFVVSGDINKFRKLAERFLNRKINNIIKINLNS